MDAGTSGGLPAGIRELENRTPYLKRSPCSNGGEPVHSKRRAAVYGYERHGKEPNGREQNPMNRPSYLIAEGMIPTESPWQVILDVNQVYMFPCKPFRLTTGFVNHVFRPSGHLIRRTV